MRVTHLEIRNFRSIRHLALDLGKTTVFVGPNNAGKTAILDALRIALTRRWGQRGTGFTEYDVHLANDTDDPKTSPGVSIEIVAEESEPEEWPDGISEDLARDQGIAWTGVTRPLAAGTATPIQGTGSRTWNRDADDHPRGQGPGIRHRVPDRAGRRGPTCLAQRAKGKR